MSRTPDSKFEARRHVRGAMVSQVQCFLLRKERERIHRNASVLSVYYPSQLVPALGYIVPALEPAIQTLQYRAKFAPALDGS